eukprot:3418267-Rhodomonas_salina.2
MQCYLQVLCTGEAEGEEEEEEAGDWKKRKWQRGQMRSGGGCVAQLSGWQPMSVSDIAQRLRYQVGMLPAMRDGDACWRVSWYAAADSAAGLFRFQFAAKSRFFRTPDRHSEGNVCVCVSGR